MPISNKKYYSEVHHIRPLGYPHNGKDVEENMIVVCPNCHRQLDYGYLKLSYQDMSCTHEIDKKNITYYTKKIYEKVQNKE